jgi:hypothetical protein
MTCVAQSDDLRGLPQGDCRAPAVSGCHCTLIASVLIELRAWRTRGGTGPICGSALPKRCQKSRTSTWCGRLRTRPTTLNCLDATHRRLVEHDTSWLGLFGQAERRDHRWRMFSLRRSNIAMVMRSSGASERTTKGWLLGKYGPGGEHLIALLANSEMALIAASSDYAVRNLISS